MALLPMRALFMALTAAAVICSCSTSLHACPEPNPAVNIVVTPRSAEVLDDGMVTVSVSGVNNPDKGDWIGMFSPSGQDISPCPSCQQYYDETGDDGKNRPLVRHYPIKTQFLSSDPSYLTKGSATVKIHVVNLRSELEFAVFSGGFGSPCLVARSQPVYFKDTSTPNFPHISSVDSSGQAVKLTWISDSNVLQQVFYGHGLSATSNITKFEKDSMNGVQSVAFDFGWHDPGFIHTAVLTGLKPSSTYTYSFSAHAAPDEKYTFRTPAASGSDRVRFLAVGDMGRAALDNSTEHLLNPESAFVVKAMAHEVASGHIDAVFHLGGLSYATGFLPQWDYFLKFIQPMASRVPYMTAMGSRERDCVNSSSSLFSNPASGGECGVPYLNYFQMPTSDPQTPWYSVEYGPVHFTVMSSEDDWHVTSTAQHEWLTEDLGSVDRTRTPWLILVGHRPVYTSNVADMNRQDLFYGLTMDPLLKDYQVDLALFAHSRQYERTCADPAVTDCETTVTTDPIGYAVYPSATFQGTVHLTVGTGGAVLDDFTKTTENWSLKRIKEHGYIKVDASPDNLRVVFKSSTTKKVLDEFRICKSS